MRVRWGRRARLSCSTEAATSFSCTPVETRPFRYCSRRTVRTSRLSPTLPPELSAHPLPGAVGESTHGHGPAVAGDHAAGPILAVGEVRGRTAQEPNRLALLRA